MIILSFVYVKSTTDQIVRLERDYIVKLIRIPNAVPPSNPLWNSISYVWEMETNQAEITKVRVNQSTGFSRYEDKIIVSVQREIGSDPSIFDKVIPAVINDQQTLNSAFTKNNKNFGKNDEFGYEKIEIAYNDTGEKVDKVTWEFDKSKLPANLNAQFSRLNRFPEGFVKTLYNIQKGVILLLSA